MVGSVRSTVSTRAALPTLSESTSRRSAAAASRVVSRSQYTSAVKRMNKRQRMSASFTFLLACGLHVDYNAMLGLGGYESVGPSFGRHGNVDAPAANGSANYNKPVTARRCQLQERKKRRPIDEDSHFVDVRL